MAQSSPMPKARPALCAAAILRMRSTRSSSLMKSEPRRKLFAKDFTHGDQIVLWLRVEICAGERAADQFHRVGKKVARGIAGAASECGHRIFRFGDLENRLNPSRRRRGRQHLVL